MVIAPLAMAAMPNQQNAGGLYEKNPKNRSFVPVILVDDCVPDRKSRVEPLVIVAVIAVVYYTYAVCLDYTKVLEGR